MIGWLSSFTPFYALLTVNRWYSISLCEVSRLHSFRTLFARFLRSFLLRYVWKISFVDVMNGSLIGLYTLPDWFLHYIWPIFTPCDAGFRKSRILRSAYEHFDWRKCLYLLRMFYSHHFTSCFFENSKMTISAVADDTSSARGSWRQFFVGAYWGLSPSVSGGRQKNRRGSIPACFNSGSGAPVAWPFRSG